MTTGLAPNLAGSVAIPSGRVLDIVKTGLTAGGLAANSARRGPDNADEAIAGNCPESARMERRRPGSEGWLTR